MDRLHDTRALSAENELLQTLARLDLVAGCALASILCAVYAHGHSAILAMAPALYLAGATLSLIAAAWEWAAQGERRSLLARLSIEMQIAIGGVE